MGSTKGPLAVLLLCCIISTAAAATCHDGATFSTTQARNLAENVGANSNFNPPLENPLSIDRLNVASMSQGTAQICIRNKFIYVDTHIDLSDVALGANDILSQCCSNADQCSGGDYTITGHNSKITVILTLQNSGENCFPQ